MGIQVITCDYLIWEVFSIVQEMAAMLPQQKSHFHRKHTCLENIMATYTALEYFFQLPK